MKKINLSVKLANSMGKVITEMRTKLTGDWKGIPPHMSIMDFKINAEYFPDMEKLSKDLVEVSEEFVNSCEFKLSEKPEDVKPFGIFFALRYDIISGSTKKLIGDIKSVLLRNVSISGEVEQVCDEEIKTVINNITVFSFPIYTKVPSDMKMHISITAMSKITDTDKASDIVRENMNEKIKVITKTSFAGGIKVSQ